jgi:hypothetical protein
MSTSDPLAPLFDCIVRALTEALSDPDVVMKLLQADDESRRACVAVLMPRVRERACQLYDAHLQEAEGWVVIE